MKISELKQIIREAVEEVSKEMAMEAGYIPGGTASMVARVDNNVFPFSSEDLEKMADEHKVKIYFIGDAQFGTENLRSYRVKFTAPQGQLDAFVDMLAQEDGIDFHEAAVAEADGVETPEESPTEPAPDAQEEPHDEADMSNPEESKEVELALKLKDIVNQLLAMHGKGEEDQKAPEEPSEPADEVDLEEPSEEPVKEAAKKKPAKKSKKSKK